MSGDSLKPDAVCEHGTALDVHCCNCHSGFLFDEDHECPDPNWKARAEQAEAEVLRKERDRLRVLAEIDAHILSQLQTQLTELPRYEIETVGTIGADGGWYSECAAVPRTYGTWVKWSDLEGVLRTWEPNRVDTQ